MDTDSIIWKWITLTILSILAIIFISVLFVEKSKGNCSKYYDFINQKYKGKVISKYLNPKDHMNATIKLDDGNLYVINPFDTTAYFDSIEIGDIVMKQSNSLSFYIINSIDTLSFIINEPDCNKYMSN